MASPPQFTVHLFAAARDLAGSETIVVSPSSGSVTVAELRKAIVLGHPQLSRLLAVSAIAVNHDFAEEERVLLPSDEIAVIPPVSGG